MGRGGKIAAVAAAAFLLVLIAQFPARWAAGALPRGTTCRQLSGTLWRGACDGLAAGGAPVGDLVWTLHPLRLVTGALSANVVLTLASGSASARIDLRPSGAIIAREVHAAFPLDHALLPELPPATRASAELDLAALRWDGTRISSIRGQIDVRGLTHRGEPLGDYRLYFPGDGSGDPVGRLTDLGGPFDVSGTVRLTREPGYAVDAQVGARPGAPPDLADGLRYLGSPDAKGRRPFSMAGTF